MKMFFYNHPYHMVSLSPWPLLVSLSIFITMIGSIKMFNNFTSTLIFMGLYSILMCAFQWWRDVVRESTFQGLHTKKVYLSLKLGMFLFIISELCFFISFFWSYFHASLSPDIEIGSLWPPKNISQFDPFNIPLLNTIILLSSGVSITYAHHSILLNNKLKSTISLYLTIMLGVSFTFIQMYEYFQAPFCLNDSIYGSLFFMTTGFHGLHVIIGSLFLMITLIRMLNNQINFYHHFSFEAAAWYWHFVDVIWIIVFTMIYWWNY